MEENLKRTPLYDAHKRLGAKFVGFGGWEMPVSYTSMIEEHVNTRENVSLFDVSHMGEVFVSGKNALKALQHLTTNDVSKLAIGRAQYSVLANEKGGAVDDIIVYRLGENDYLVCVNASNREKDFQWMIQHNPYEAVIEDRSDAYAQIAIQGPKGAALFAKLLGMNPTEFSREKFPGFSVRKFPDEYKSIPLIAARTGYTGEDGFEVFLPAESAEKMWQGLLDIGAEFNVKPSGLAARDTLRLEACLCLYGHELSDDRDILSAGLGWVTKFDKEEFIGKAALEAINKSGVQEKLCGFEVVDPGIVREGAEVFDASGALVGKVTSGTKPPTVGKAIAMAYVPVKYSQPGSELFAEVRGKKLRMRGVPIPFYKRSK